MSPDDQQPVLNRFTAVLTISVPAVDDPTGAQLRRYVDRRGIGVWFDNVYMGLSDLLWVDTPPDDVVRTLSLRCHGCGRQLGGLMSRWFDGAMYCVETCWRQEMRDLDWSEWTPLRCEACGADAVGYVELGDGRDRAGYCADDENDVRAVYEPAELEDGAR